MDHACAVRITYCTQCNWLLRASWMSSELLSTFGTDLAAVTLVPDTGGVFTVEVDGTMVWDRSRDGGFPDIVTLKQRVRDVAVPDRDLGHGERTHGKQVQGDQAQGTARTHDNSARTTESDT